ncbi:clathrin coat assembly protein AP180 [Heracleum sosnowskyi]|uniref:Clathrin coat assembly protein AP180 n=1 Tax=Heracleum sosnowskyi TaxID=360622 RepID=A0AAD8JMZ4_9APIA|nr:clathrin coat assembly protein AP180 [Heracleum sosnowskyi]
MPSKIKKAIGAVKDQTSISLAKVGSSTNLEVAILKATTHENIPTDERYINEIVGLVSSDKTYAKSCARAIGKRVGRTRNWIVALKSLMLVLRIFQDGDPYFPREVLHATRRGAKILNLTKFRNDSNSGPRDYTAFVRTFALYLDERLDCFLTGKLQRRYTFKDRERGGQSKHPRNNMVIRDMKPPMLLDRITFWQRLLDRAIATSPSGAARTNRLILIALYAIVQESFDLYKDISDGLTLLLDSFFHLQYNLCVGAFEACVKASKQYQDLIEYYSYCQNLGVGRTSEYPSIQTISQQLIETLQEFLKDQSSFPAVTKSPQMLALPAPSTRNSSRHESYDSCGGQSEFSEFSTSIYSGGVSDFGSHCTSLEELLGATDTVTRQGISIDLEAYNIDQFDDHTPRDETLRTSDAGSTHSLPELNAMTDLLSLDDWPEQTQEAASEQHQSQLSSASGWDLVLAEAIQQPSHQLDPNESITFNALPQQEQKGQETSSADNWELMLAETRTEPIQQTQHINFSLDNLYNQSAVLPPEYTTTSENQTLSQLEPDKPNTFDPFLEPEQINGQEMSSRQAWELAIADTATQPSQQQPDFTSSLDDLYHQPATTSTITYNPFLEESGELAILPSVADPTTTSTSPANFEAGLQTNDAFSAAPTFEATPADTAPTFLAAAPKFSAQNPNENDPFSDLATEQMFNGSINQQNLLLEQQSWLQHQNEIIAKHMA